MNPTTSDRSPLDLSASPTERTPDSVSDDLVGVTESMTIPVIEEQVQVRKEVIETGKIRLVKTVGERQEEVEVPLFREELTVERVPVNQYVDAAPASRQEGNTTIYPVVSEVLVVEKRLMLVEEIRVTRQVINTIDKQSVSLRHEVVTVERDAPANERPS